MVSCKKPVYSNHTIYDNRTKSTVSIPSMKKSRWNANVCSFSLSRSLCTKKVHFWLFKFRILTWINCSYMQKTRVWSFHFIPFYSFRFDLNLVPQRWWWVCSAHYALTSSNLYIKSNLSQRAARKTLAASTRSIFRMATIFGMLGARIPNSGIERETQSKTIRLQFLRARERNIRLYWFARSIFSTVNLICFQMLMVFIHAAHVIHFSRETKKGAPTTRKRKIEWEQTGKNACIEGIERVHPKKGVDKKLPRVGTSDRLKGGQPNETKSWGTSESW